MTGKQDTDLASAGKQLVTMDNALIRAAHGLSVTEKRLVCIAISQLDGRSNTPAGAVLVSRVKASSYAETFGLDIETAYEQLQESANDLHSRTITFYTPAGPRKGKPLPPTRHKMNWVGRSSYQKGEGWVEIAWWPEVIPYLTGLTEQFTTYKLQQASTIRSMYAWRLLELLSQFEKTGKTGWFETTVEDFAESMGASDGQRANFAKMRIQVIEQAVKELTEKDGWIIDWSATKRGRRVHSLRFDFKRNEQLSLELTPKALAKAAPPAAPAYTPAQQQTIDLLDRTFAEQRAAISQNFADQLAGLDRLLADMKADKRVIAADDQQAIDLLDHTFAEQRAVISQNFADQLAGLDRLLADMKADKRVIAADVARESKKRKKAPEAVTAVTTEDGIDAAAIARAGAKASHKIKRNRQRIEGDNSTDRVPFDG